MARTVANPDAPYLGRAVSTAGQLLRLLEEQGLSGKSEQRVIDDLDFRIALAVWWETNANPELPVDGCTLAQAAQIMGSNFLGPAAVRRHFNPELARQQIFQSVPFSVERLKAVRDTHLLVAVSALSLVDLFYMNRDLFPFFLKLQERTWFTETKDPFARAKPEIGWYLVRASVVPDSKKKTWYEQQALLGPDEFVPTAAIVVQAAFLYLRWSRRRLLTDWFQTSDKLANGDHPILFQEDPALNVYTKKPTDKSKVIGLASAIKIG